MPRPLLPLVLLLTAAGLPAEPLHLLTTEFQKPFEGLVLGVLNQSGIEATVETVPQARLVASLSHGDADGGFFFTDIGLAQIPGLVKIDAPLYQNDLVAVTISPSVKVVSAADLAKYKVGIVRGSKALEAIVKDLKNVIVSADSVLEFKMLSAGRTDVAIAPRAVVPSLAKEVRIPHYFVLEPPLMVQPEYFALTKKNEDLVARVTPAFQKAVSSGAWAHDVGLVLARMNQ